MATINGTSGPDTLTGTAAADTIYGDAGDDTINGGNGNDSIDGGPGDDTVNGQGGDDTIYSRSGRDHVYGGVGNDTVYTEATWPGAAGAIAGPYVVDGGPGNDTLFVESGSGPAQLSWANVRNFETINLANGLTPTFADATIQPGTTTLVNGNYSLDDRAETDGHLIYVANSSTFTNGVTVWAGAQSDNLTGSQYADHLDGGGGDDVINGLVGFDFITGGGGADTMTGGGSSGGDHFIYNALSDSTVAAPDTITDFVTGDRIDLTAINVADVLAGGANFHLGPTAGHAGDMVVSYDAGLNQTTVDLFVDGDATPDARILLSGNPSVPLSSFILGYQVMNLADGADPVLADSATPAGAITKVAGGAGVDDHQESDGHLDYVANASSASTGVNVVGDEALAT